MHTRLSILWPLAALALVAGCNAKRTATADPKAPEKAPGSKAKITLEPWREVKPARMPAPPNFGSDKARVRSDDTLAKCAAGARPTGDPAARARAIAAACAKTKSGQAQGASIKAKQGAGDGAFESPLQAQSGDCIGIAFASDPGVESLSVLVVDSSGKKILESTFSGGDGVATNEGPICFSRADGARLVLSVGAGSGNVAAALFAVGPQ